MTQPAGRDQALAEAFVSLADTLVDDYDVIDLLDRLVSHSVRLLAAHAAGLLLADSDGRLHLAAASSKDAELLELMQLQAEQGPCLECYETKAPVSVADLATAEQRWPRFAAAVTERGVYASVHALPLRLRGDTIGALNLLHHTPGPLPDEDLALGQALADIATIGILQERAIRQGERVTGQLQTALDSRVSIEQAKGVLAQRFRLSMDEAFKHLRGYSRRRNLRLSEVARAVAEGRLAPESIAPAELARGDSPPGP